MLYNTNINGGNSMKENKLKAKDFITIGIFTALVFVVEFAYMMLGFIHPYVILSYAVAIPVLCAIPMMLFYTKVEKFGMITIMSVLIAIIMFVTGMGWIGAPLIIAAGVIADLIAKKGNYKSFKSTVLSHGVFCIWVGANYIPLVVTADDYKQDMIKGGFSEDYCNTLFNAVNGKTIALILLCCFIFGVVGAFIGKAVVRKHFEKAGIV